MSVTLDLAAKASRINIADLAEGYEDERQEAISRAWAAYDGEGPLPFDGADAVDNVRLGVAELIVDKGVSFLAGKGGVEFQLDPTEPELEEDPDGDAEAAEAERERLRDQARAELDAAWPREDRNTDFHLLATNGAVAGHAWVRLYDDGTVEILDPSNVTAIWDEDNVNVLLGYLVQWLTVDADIGMGAVRRQRFEPAEPIVAKRRTSVAWTIHEEEWDGENGEWVPILDEGGEPVVEAWDHGDVPPILGCQNRPAPNTFYGKPDLTSAILDLIEQFQAVASDMRRIVRLHGHPVPVVLGATMQDVHNLEVAIGHLLAISGGNGDKIPQLSQLQVAEITSSLALFKELKAAIFEEAQIPRVALGDRDKSGAVTGVALQIEYQPIVEKTETKRLGYGPLLTRIAESVLALRGVTGWRVTLGWPQILPTDEQAATDSAEADLRMGIVSKQTISEKRGYDWDVEQERIAAEREAAQAVFDRGQFDDDDDLPPGADPDNPPDDEEDEEE